MTSRVQITAHHKGYIQFHYCAQNNQVLTAQELENCFQSNVLQIQGQGDKFSVPEPSAADYADQGYWYDVPVMIPNVECSRCVLRWTYHAGNGWGCDAPDDCGIGKGYQEEFKNCADVMISSDGTPPTTTTTTTTTTTNTGPTTTTTTGTTTTTTKDPMTFCDPWQETWERRGFLILFLNLSGNEKTALKQSDYKINSGPNRRGKRWLYRRRSCRKEILQMLDFLSR